MSVLAGVADTDDFRQLAILFKRVRNIVSKNVKAAPGIADRDHDGEPLDGILVEPAEQELWREFERRRPVIEASVAAGQSFKQAFDEAAKFGPAVARFFDDVMVMTEDARLREARLRLMWKLEQLILQLADVSEIVPQES